EIVITDTGSTDRTIEIARSYGAKVYQMEWKDDFAAARNNSLMNCTCDWVLYIDADERLTPESQKNIKRYISQALPDVGALICTIESDHNYLDGNSEVHRGGYPRLFRNLGYPKVKFVGRVHEQISPSLIDAGYTFAISDLKIMHLGYNVSRKEMEEKVRRNYRMLIAHVQEEPLNGYAWFQLGQTLSQMQLFREAEEAIRFAIKCGDLSKTIYSSAAAALSQLSGRRGDFNEALRWADAALEKSPNQIYGITLKAFALLNLNRATEAIPYFEQALQMLKQSEKYFTFGSPAFDIDISEEVLTKGLASAKQKVAAP
ncbi:MAG TPA: glycosyltransferase, partial [Candidatus Kapabacteria bacterium]|nr:glycosyltransferase [Candidatus Kapabacteria bacterium]